METITSFIVELDALIKRNGLLEKRIAELESVSNNRPKLAASDVSTIRDLKRSGYTQSEIADIFDINPATVSRIVRRIYH